MVGAPSVQEAETSPSLHTQLLPSYLSTSVHNSLVLHLERETGKRHDPTRLGEGGIVDKMA